MPAATTVMPTKTRNIRRVRDTEVGILTKIVFIAAADPAFFQQARSDSLNQTVGISDIEKPPGIKKDAVDSNAGVDGALKDFSQG